MDRRTFLKNTAVLSATGFLPLSAGAQLVPAAFWARKPKKVKEVLTKIGLSTGLILALDAGDGASYGGTGQVWSDVSGQNNNFNRGVGAGADAADPTFIGVADGQSNQYWSFDGADYFSAVGSPTYANSFHKAGALFSFASFIYWPGVDSTQIFGTSRSRSENGALIFVRGSSSALSVAIQHGTGTTTAAEIESAGTVPTNTWVFLAGCFNAAAGAGGSYLMINEAVTVANGTLTSPAVGNPAYSPGVGGVGNVALSPAGTRFGYVCLWNTAVSSVQMTSLYQATRKRYGV